MKSPAARTPQKAYKHVKFMPLSHVRRVVDIRDNDGKCTLLVRPSFNIDHCRSRVLASLRTNHEGKLG